jgi:antitoxin YefM
MDVKTYSDARQNLADLMDRVCESRAPVVVTRQKAKSVVMISLEEYAAIEETLHLLRSPKNAARLHAAIAELEKGRGVQRDPTTRKGG